MYQDRLRSVESLAGGTVPFVLAKESTREMQASRGQRCPLNENLTNFVTSFDMENVRGYTQSFLHCKFKCQVSYR